MAEPLFFVNQEKPSLLANQINEVVLKILKCEGAARDLQLNKKRLSNRALSPIFATLIILAVVTVLFIPVFIWASGLTSQTEDSWAQSGQTATERIVIEEVSLTTDQIKIYVRNIGKTAVSINDVLIEDSDKKIITYDQTQSELITLIPGTTTTKDSIVQGELIAIIIEDLKGLNLDSEIFTVKVFTDRGVGESYQLVA